MKNYYLFVPVVLLVLAIAMLVGHEVNGQTHVTQKKIIKKEVKATSTDDDSVKVIVKTITKTPDGKNISTDSLLQAFKFIAEDDTDNPIKIIKIMHGDTIITECWSDSLANLWLEKFNDDSLFPDMKHIEKRIQVFSDSMMNMTFEFNSLFDPLQFFGDSMNIEWTGNMPDLDSIITKHVKLNMNNLDKHLIFIGDDGKEIRIEKDGELVFINKEDGIDDMDSNIEVTVNKKGQKVILLQTRIVLDDLSDAEVKELKSQGIQTSKKEPEFDYIKFYPNPSDDAINIQFQMTKKADAEVKISNMLGQVIFNEELKDFSGEYNKAINLKDHGKGTYILQISQGKRITTRKIIVE